MPGIVNAEKMLDIFISNISYKHNVKLGYFIKSNHKKKGIFAFSFINKVKF